MKAVASRRGQGTSIMNWIIAAIAVVIAIVLVVLVYSRVSGGLGALGTAQATASIVPGGLQVVVTAIGGGVTVQGIVILDPVGNVLFATGTTPGYRAPSSSAYTWSGLYINGASGPVNTPFSLSNGQSATLTLTGNTASTTPATVIVFYNNGKMTQAQVSS